MRELQLTFVAANAVGLLLLSPSVLCYAQVIDVTLLKPPTEKGTVVVSGTFASQGNVVGVSTSFSRDGVDFRLADAHGGLARYHEPYWSVRNEGQTTTINVLVFGFSDSGVSDFIFEGSGNHHLPLQVTFEREGVDGVEGVVKVPIRPGPSSDVGFVRRLSNPKVCSQLWGTEVFSKFPDEFRRWIASPSGSDYRAILVVNELLDATRAKEPGDAIRPRETLENALRWTDALSELAREFPDSSYAPYARYYAGVCYLADIQADIQEVRREGIRERDHSMTRQDWETLLAATRGNPNYQKAQEALHLAVEKADAYLKPRALYMNAFFHLLGLAWDEADRALNEAAAAGGGDPVISEMVANLRRDLVQNHERYNKGSKDEQEKNSQPKP